MLTECLEYCNNISKQGNVEHCGASVSKQCTTGQR